MIQCDKLTYHTLFETLILIETKDQLSSTQKTPVVPPLDQSAPINAYRKKNWKKWIVMLILIGGFISILLERNYIVKTQGKFCGGIAGNLPQNQCPLGFICRLDGNYPDAGGTCQLISSKTFPDPTPTIFPESAVTIQPTTSIDYPKSTEQLDLHPFAKLDKTLWAVYSDPNYHINLYYPPPWSIEDEKTFSDHGGGMPRFILGTSSKIKTTYVGSPHVRIQFGDPEVFSTTGSLYCSGVCENAGQISVPIRGKTYTTSIMKQSVNKNGINELEYYAFQLENSDISVSLPSYASSKVSPYITSYFYTPEEGQAIVNILSTIEDQNQTTDISSWQTYKNDQNGIEFQYPPQWSITHFIDNSPFDYSPTLTFSYEIQGSSSQTYTTLYLGVTCDKAIKPTKYQFTSVTTLKQTFPQIIRYSHEDFSSLSKDIQKFPVVRYKVSGHAHYCTFDFNGGMVSDPNNFLPLFDQILSTFKFTK